MDPGTAIFVVVLAVHLLIAALLIRAFRRRRSAPSPLIVNPYTLAVEPDADRIGVYVEQDNQYRGPEHSGQGPAGSPATPDDPAERS